MPTIVFGLFTVVCASLLALLEIQIEGRDGWAAKLPTWRIDTRLTRMFMSGKPLTGYHVCLFAFVAVISHAPIGVALAEWSWRLEARIAAFVIFLWIMEDFLWFVFNPDYGIRRFRKEHIWWHAPAWWWIAPKDYWVFAPIGIALYAFSRTGL